MEPDGRGDPGSRREGEAARDRLLASLADAAVLSVVTGLLDGVDGDRPGALAVDPEAESRAVGEPRRGPVPFLERVCALAVPEVGVSGAGVTVMGSLGDGIAGYRDQVACGGASSRELEDLQLTAGEGPCLDAFAAGAPVLAGDLAAEADRWPGFAPEALAAGVGAVFSLPLQVGVVRLGTLDLYRVEVGPLTPTQLGAALTLAGLVTETLLEHTEGGPDDRADGEGAGPAEVGWLADVHADVHQASGMVSVAEQIGVGEALVRIRAHAFAESRPIAEVAARIIARDLVLSDPDPDP